MISHAQASSGRYSPDEPRVPAGDPEGGQWTAGGASGALSGAEAERALDKLTAPKDLTRSEEIALARYQAGTYQEINAMYRGQPGPSWDTGHTPAEVRQMGITLRGLVDRAPPIPKDLIAYRAIHNPAAVFGGNPEDMVGGSIRDEGFVSVTTDKAQAERWGSRNLGGQGGPYALVEIRVPAGSRGLWVQNVADQTNVYVKKELILQQGGNVFRIRKVRKISNRAYHVIAEMGR